MTNQEIYEQLSVNISELISVIDQQSSLTETSQLCDILYDISDLISKLK